MERGTDWERRVVRERWQAMERQQALVTRLLGGLVLASSGVILLVLGASRAVCFTTAEGGIIECMPMPNSLAMALLGALALGGGLWVCWAALNR